MSRYALIIAGGSGTRLWPMSRAAQPKQLIPFIHGKSLLQIAVDRLDGLVDDPHLYVCAGRGHQRAIVDAVEKVSDDRFLAEPVGRDTLNAVGFAAAVLHQRDPNAIIAVFTADHVIEPVEKFQAIIRQGFELVEQHPETLVTFGIQPSEAATGYGYLELGQSVGDDGDGLRPRIVNQFREKPVAETAQQFFDAGPDKYLWNSGMFVWHARTLMDCIRRFTPENHDALTRLAEAYETPRRDAVLDEIYPTLPKISVDYAVMEPAPRDDHVRVAAVPMPLTWLDVGSWPSFAGTLEPDAEGNTVGGGQALCVDAAGNLLASTDPKHVIAAVGCEDLIVVHTDDATLVCRKDHAQKIKKVHGEVLKRFGDRYV